MKTVIKSLAIAGVGHLVILNATGALATIARKESVQNTKFGKKLHKAMSVVSLAASGYGVIINPDIAQENIEVFYDDYLTTLLETWNK